MIPVLKSNLEEVDARVTLHAVHHLNCDPNKYIIRSPSGDTDILVTCVSMIENKERVFLYP